MMNEKLHAALYKKGVYSYPEYVYYEDKNLIFNIECNMLQNKFRLQAIRLRPNIEKDLGLIHQYLINSVPNNGFYFQFLSFDQMAERVQLCENVADSLLFL